MNSKNKKLRFFALIFALGLVFCSCEKVQVPGSVTGMYMNLTLSFGEVSGSYTGQVATPNGADGDANEGQFIPDGDGIFTAASEGGADWYYDGAWVQGHFSGKGTLGYVGGSVYSGEFAEDYLNGQGAQTNAEGVMIEEGLYEKGVLIEGTLRDNMGNIYYEGRLNEGFLAESAEERAERIARYCSAYTPFDCEGCLAGTQKAGTKVVYEGVVDYVWPLEDEKACFDEFSLKCEGGTGWVMVMRYHLSSGEKRVVMGEKVTVYGVIVYTTTEDGGELYDAPVIYAI